MFKLSIITIEIKNGLTAMFTQLTVQQVTSYYNQIAILGYLVNMAAQPNFIQIIVFVN